MHRHRNGLKTAALLGLLSALILLAGSALAGSTGLAIALVVALGVNGFAYFNSATIALRSMRARPVSEAEAPGLYRIVRELSTAARQPMPALYVSPTAAPNAFATGRNPRNAAVCCTEGILGLLTERELRGVLAHELAHVYNRDILTASVAAGFASVIMYVAQFAWLLPMGNGGDEDEGAGNMVVRAPADDPRPGRRDGHPDGDQPSARVPGGRGRRRAHRRPARAGERAAQARGRDARPAPAARSPTCRPRAR